MAIGLGRGDGLTEPGHATKGVGRRRGEKKNAVSHVRKRRPSWFCFYDHQIFIYDVSRKDRKNEKGGKDIGKNSTQKK